MWPMSTRTDVLEAYHDGFRRSDHAAILALLTDDVVWEIVGFSRHRGKAAFDAEIENPAFEGSPTLVIDRMLESADAVTVVGRGVAHPKGAGDHPFSYCDVFTFSGDLIRRVESYVVGITPQDLDR